MKQLIKVPIKGVTVSLTFEQAESLLHKLQRAIYEHPQCKAVWKEILTDAKQQYEESKIKYPDELFNEKI